MAPYLGTSDLDIQQRANVWKTHNPTDGSQIGGTMPTNYGLSHEVPGRPGAMQLFVEGPAWATMMAYTQRALFMSQPDHIQLDFDVEVLDGNAALTETDIIVVIPAPTGTVLPGTTTQATGVMLNMSLQDLGSEGGQLQDVMTQGSWVNIPNAKPGMLTVGKHHYTITGTWNQAAQTYGLTSVTIDQTTYPVIQSAPGKPCNWAPGVSIQFQITLAPLPAGQTWGSTSLVVDHVNLQQIAA